MNIYSLKGQIVTVTEETAKHGYSHDKEKVKDMVGKNFTVLKTHVGSSHTSVVLAEFPEEVFNSVNFESVTNQTPEDNAKHPDYGYYH